MAQIERVLKSTFICQRFLFKRRKNIVVYFFSKSNVLPCKALTFCISITLFHLVLLSSWGSKKGFSLLKQPQWPHLHKSKWNIQNLDMVVAPSRFCLLVIGHCDCVFFLEKERLAWLHTVSLNVFQPQLNSSV